MDIQTSTQGNVLTVDVTFEDGESVSWAEDLDIMRSLHTGEDVLEVERKTVCSAVNMAISNALAMRDYTL